MLKVREVAARLNLSESKVYALIESGELPHHRFGGAIRVSDQQVADFLEQTKHERSKPEMPKGRNRAPFRHLKL